MVRPRRATGLLPQKSLLRIPATLLHQRRDRLACPARFAESRDHAGAIGFGPVLAHLPFALDPGDLNLDADDGAHLHLDEVRRRIVDGPGRGAPRLPALGEILDLLA